MPKPNIEDITQIAADVEQIVSLGERLIEKYGRTRGELLHDAAVALRKHRNEVRRGRPLLARLWFGRYEKLTARAARKGGPAT